MRNRKRFDYMRRSDWLIVNIAFASCLIACAGDFIMTYILGDYFPHYSQLHDSMSRLGSASSPVSTPVSIWWIILCILLVMFAIGFKKSFSSKDLRIKIASILIVIYGLGEGLGSAVFPLNHAKSGLNMSGGLHILSGGLGTAAILILPLVLQNIFTDAENPNFKKFSLTIFIAGLVFVSFIVLGPFTDKSTNPVESFQGLWQRLYVLDVYIFLIVIAFRMRKNVLINRREAE